MSRSAATYRTLGELTLTCASVGENVFVTPARPEPAHFSQLALRRFGELDGGDGLVATGRETDGDSAAKLMMEWLLGHRLLKAHRQSLEVQFRLDTVESKTAALRDLVQVSGAAGVLEGIFLLLDELEKQGGVLGPRAVIRYLSAVRAIVDALPKRLFLMLAVTPDALERYSFSLPALRSRLENRIELSPLTEIDEAVKLAQFYIDDARRRASRSRSAGGAEQIVEQRNIENLYRELESDATRRGDTGVRQREFLHRLHTLAERTVRAP